MCKENKKFKNSKGEIVEVLEEDYFTDSYHDCVLYCVVFRKVEEDSDFCILTGKQFEEQYKPYVSEYGYKFAYLTYDGVVGTTISYYKDKDGCLRRNRNYQDCTRLDFTKKEL